MKFRWIVLVVMLGIPALGAVASIPAPQPSEAPARHQKNREFSDLALFALGVAGLVAGRQTIRKRRH